MSADDSQEPTGRMSAADRRSQVLAAAVQAFAAGGYHGTSTDAVARQAGVSQPYVVRMFGTKLELFLEVFDHAVARIHDAFAGVAAQDGFDVATEDGVAQLGEAYTDLVADQALLQVMMHGFSAGSVPEIAAHARTGMARISATLRSTGLDDDSVRDFIAHGMLLNVMLAMRSPEHLGADPDLDALTVCTFGEALPGPAEV
ncbi:TetR/AcrR family transcriptional regulator [Nocardioides nanhaiensis]|uniref:TetR family transcriptional regulator n=1 Tax=Nocardioides nanhaiensis TaxID=1476871 RepID=A0ABP8W129_9ACTN